MCARADNLVCRALRSTGDAKQDDKKFRLEKEYDFIKKLNHLNLIASGEIN